MHVLQIRVSSKVSIMNRMVAPHHFRDISELMQVLNFMEIPDLYGFKSHRLYLKLELLYTMMVGLMVMELS
jgi:hypothetical protein